MEECRRFLFCFIFLTSLESIQMLSHYYFDFFFFFNPLHKLNSYGISLSLPPSLTNRQNVLCLSFTDAKLCCLHFRQCVTHAATVDTVLVAVWTCRRTRHLMHRVTCLFWSCVTPHFGHCVTCLFWTCTTPHFSIIRRCDTLSSAGV